ncbi:hypothetical protein BXT84_00540 [Sulfobacillus thermotolerans]|uniref:Actin-like protein N-terminal domain-containing protein n=1 Tax=Sulfobacillus thermotolerans TaxID=338644 RepID=A0ABM6RMP7_9FIRM|nr:hypothetical protein BXT84_00540 [Sulfobacillus thermotolerans]
MIKIAIDAGHGYTKALAATGQRVMFPSLIAAVAPGMDLVDLGQWDRKSQRGRVLLDNHEFVYGEDARRLATPLWSREKAADPDAARFILIAAGLLGATGPIQIAVGLPLSWFAAQRKEFKAALMGYGAQVAFPEQGRGSQRIWIDAVTVLPQGVAAAVSTLGTALSTVPESWIVLDIGYRTSDFCWIDRTATGELDFERDRAGTLEIGYHDVVDQARQEMERTYHLPFREAELESAPSVIVRGHMVDVSALRHMATRAVAHRMAQELQIRLGDGLERVTGVLLVGGAAEQFSDRFPWPTQVANDSQWANAIGYLAVL